MATKLLAFYYNSHLTNFFYPEEIEEKMAKYGLPISDCDVLQYDMSLLKAPFHIDENQNIILVTEEVPPEGPTPMNLKSVFEEIKKSAIGKKFIEAIAANSKLLRENNIPLIPIEFDGTELETPVFYSVDETLEPIPFMKKGKMIRDFATGKKI